jgi:hypothetical protein
VKDIVVLEEDKAIEAAHNVVDVARITVASLMAKTMRWRTKRLMVENTATTTLLVVTGRKN